MTAGWSEVVPEVCVSVHATSIAATMKANVRNEVVSMVWDELLRERRLRAPGDETSVTAPLAHDPSTSSFSPSSATARIANALPLAWTEAVTLITDGHVPEPLFDEVRSHFSETELSDLTLAVATINAWNRLSISARLVPGAYNPQSGQR